MESKIRTEALSALSHPARLDVFRLLVRRLPDRVRPSEMAQALGLKPNTLSVYLSVLERAGLISAQRAGRALYYRAEIATMDDLLTFLVGDCCQGRPAICPPQGARDTGGLINVLFVCTGNSARSLMAEAALTRDGTGRFQAFSAGLRPFSSPNPAAIALLQREGLDIDPLHSKNIAVFQGGDAPQMDIVLTLCDRAANEGCPPWQGAPVCAHWGLPDPAAPAGDGEPKSARFQAAFDTIARRVQALAALPMETLHKPALQSKLDAIGLLTDPVT